MKKDDPIFLLVQETYFDYRTAALAIATDSMSQILEFVEAPLSILSNIAEGYETRFPLLSSFIIDALVRRDLINALTDPTAFTNSATVLTALEDRADETVSLNLTDLEWQSGTNLDDVIDGTTESEIIFGADGNDEISGGAGNDAVSGGNGNDILNGGIGNDNLSGGNGNDFYTFNIGDGNDTLTDFDIANDIIRINGQDLDPELGLAGVDIQQSGDNVAITYGTGPIAGDTIVLENIILDEWLNGLTPETIDGTTGNDTINASFVDADGESVGDGGQIIFGGAGDDRIYDGAGDDTVDGGTGRDLFYAGAGADQYEGGGTERDEVFYTTATSGLTIDMTDAANSTGIAAGDTFSNIEFVHGSEFDDIIIAAGQRAFGRGGNDVLQDAAGYQVLNGGSGNDTFRFIAGDGSQDRIEDFTSNEDVIDLSLWGVTSLTDTGFSIYERVNGQGELQGDLIISFNGETIQLQGLTTADIAGLDASHFIFADPVDPPDPNQFDGATIDGTAGNDTINTSFVDIDGEEISDGGQIILGGAGDDRIYDGAGDDTVDGGTGRDLFYAGDGADHYEGGGTERDEVFYTTATAGLTIDMTNAANSTGIAAGDTFSNIEFLHGSEFDDVIVANGQRVFGRGGDDIIQDAAGHQMMFGGSGSDTFVFIAGDGQQDRVDDFTLNEDVIDLSLWGVTSLTDAGLNIYERADGQGNLQGDLIIAYNGDSVRLDGLTTADIASLDQDHFMFA